MSVEDVTKEDLGGINIRHSECNSPVQDRKSTSAQKTEKTYKVTVTYIQLSDEEAKIKRAIIESIMRKGYNKPNI